MPMDRDLLKYFLNSGPSKRFDIPRTSQTLREQWGKAPPAFFNTAILNRAVLFKYLDTESKRGGSAPLKTLMYFPYDVAKPGEGGESVVYSQEALFQYLSSNKDFVRLNHHHLQNDYDKLDVLDSVPTFNPFLLEGAFERAGVYIDTDYLLLDLNEAGVVKRRLRARLRPLVYAAFAQSTKDHNTYLESIVDKIWAGQIDTIMPLIEALRIPRESAAETLSAWSGMTFFEYEFNRLSKDMRDFAEWFKCFSMPREALPPELAQANRHTAEHIRGKVRENWGRALTILKTYQTTYQEFIGEETKLEPFLDFLHHSKAHFWRLGVAIGQVDQTIYAWRTYTRNYEKQNLPYDRLAELYFVLNAAN